MSTPKKIELIARALIFRDGKVLLCRSVDGGHRYLPGGHVEPGESSRQALTREMLEEAGIAVRVGNLALVHEHCFEQGGRARHEVNLVFHVELEPHQGMLTSREAEIAFDWEPLASLQRSGFVPQDLAGPLAAIAVGTVQVDRGVQPRPTAAFLTSGW